MWDWLNRDLLPIKAHYFLFNAGTAPVQPFMTVYAKQLGFSSVVVGIIYGILPVVGMLSKLGIGALADRLRMRKSLFISFLILGTVSFFAVQFVPYVKEISTDQVDFDCGVESNIKICSELTQQKCLADHFREKEDDMIQCFMDCDLAPEMVSHLCHDWNMTKFCGFQLSTPSPTNSIESAKDSRSISGKTSYQTGSLEARLEFTADVPLQHTVPLQDCIFLRVASAVFADGSSSVPWCSSLTTTKCKVMCSDGTVNQLMHNVTEVDTDVSGRYQFWLLFWLLVFSWVGMAVVVSLSDAICFELLGDKAGQYGQQRLWGSVGWGTMAIISGLLVDYYSEGEFEKNYTSSFYLLFILWSADIACAYTIKYEQTKVSKSIWLDVGKLLMNPRILIFMLSCIIVGMCTGLQWSFLYWYLEELATAQGCGTLSWIKTLQGLVSGVQCFLGELPYFFLSGMILHRLGHIHCMSLILFFISIRLLLYSALTDPWWTLPIELFQGVYGLFYPTMASYANAVAPPGTEATVQGMVGAVFEGVGVALGSFLAGLSYSRYSGAVTFRIFGLGALIACIIHVGVQYILGKRSTRYNPKGFTGLSTGNEAVAMLEVT